MDGCLSGKKRSESGDSSPVDAEPDWLAIWAFGRQELGLADAEFWSYTWRELEALADTFRKRERRLDQRTAMLRYQMVLCWAKDPPSWEEFFPDEDAIQETADERMIRKADLVMAQYGGTMSTRISDAQPIEADEWTKKMWRLMGVTN